VPTPQEIAWAALEQISLRLETEPATIFVETAEILRRYWTATGLVPAASLTTKEVLAILTTQEPPPGVTWETVGVALQQADQMKFAGASVGVTEARPWLDLVRVLVGRVRPPDAPQG
jgi:DNA-binding IclR family transcriptional regulator